MFVADPSDIKVVSKESLEAAKIMEEIVEASNLDPYDRIKNEGFWRILLFRESKATK